MKTNNWNPVVGSLLSILQDHGFVLEAVDGGLSDDPICLTGTPRSRRQQAKRMIVAVERSGVYLINVSPIGLPHALRLSLTEEPAEIITATLNLPKDHPALKAFRDKWKGKPCPTK